MWAVVYRPNQASAEVGEVGLVDGVTEDGVKTLPPSSITAVDSFSLSTTCKLLKEWGALWFVVGCLSPFQTEPVSLAKNWLVI